MECDSPNDQKLFLTNQDSFPVLVKFANGDVYQAEAAKKDVKTGIFVPTTSVKCMSRDAGDMTIEYTHGDKCIHKKIEVDRWSSQEMGLNGEFYYTIPAWDIGNPSDVCLHSASNNTSEKKTNQNLPVDKSNASWWDWFTLQHSKNTGMPTWMWMMIMVLIIILVVYLVKMFLNYNEPNCATHVGCYAALELQNLLKAINE